MINCGQPNSSSKLDQQTCELLLNYFFLSRQQRRKFDWQQKNVCLYKALFPLLYDDIDLQQIVISPLELNEKFNKFFSTSFRTKSINNSDEDVYNLNQLVIFTLDQKVHICQATKKTCKFQQKLRSNIIVKFNQLKLKLQIQPWSKIQYSNNLIKLSVQTDESKIMYVDKNLYSRFRIQLLNQDYTIKSNFINNFLFCSQSPSFSTSSIAVEKLKKGHILKDFSENVYVLFEGQAIQQIEKKNVGKNNQVQKTKWKLQLLKGSIICKNHIKSVFKTAQNNFFNESPYIYTYSILTDSVFLTIPFQQLTRILRTDKKTKKQLLRHLSLSQQTHQQLIERSVNVKNFLRSSESTPIQIYYPIPKQTKGNKKSKVFRRKTQIDNNDQNYQDFITFDRYQKMTQNKQNVQKKHLIYSHLNNLIRQKQKQQRFIKKMNSPKGMKQIKKCEYQARLKQTKIQSLAIKDSILNAQKYRDRPHQVKFIFQQQMLDRYLKNKTQLNITPMKNKNKFVSMVQLDQQIISQVQGSKIDFKAQYKSEFKQNNQSFTKNKVRPFSRFCNRSAKLLRFQSSPNIFQTPNYKRKCIGSVLNTEKEFNFIQ